MRDRKLARIGRLLTMEVGNRQVWGTGLHLRRAHSYLQGPQLAIPRGLVATIFSPPIPDLLQGGNLEQLETNIPELLQPQHLS